MRILIFCTADLSIGSGSEVRARLISLGMKHHGVTVHVVSGGVPPEFAKKGITFSLIRPGETSKVALDRATKKFEPDFIIGVTEAGADVVHKVARKYNVKYILDLHGFGFVEVLELGSGYGSRLRRCYMSLKWLSRILTANAVTVANPTLVQFIKPFNRHTIPVVGMTDTDYFSPEGPKANLGNKNSNIHVLYAGNFFKWQGIDLLIKAIPLVLEKNPNFYFTIIGSVGADHKIMDSWKKSLPKQSVNFIDSVDFRDVAAYYRAADILVIPRPFMLSTYLAIPQKLLDYMSCGKTILATNLAPHRWALSPNAGILCETSAEGIAKGLLSASNERERDKLGKNARKVALERFDHIKQTKKIFDFCKLMIGKG